METSLQGLSGETGQSETGRPASPGGKTGLTEGFERPGVAEYSAVAFGLGLLGALLRYEVVTYGHVVSDARVLLGPVFALFFLLFVCWAATLILRNYAVISGRMTGAYYVDYRYDRDTPPEWVEQVARTLNNVMQLPPWFMLLCVLQMVVARSDQAQLALAWTFVVLRFAHAAIYAGWNYVPARFGLYVGGVVTLIVMTCRFAMQTADLW